MVAGKFARIGSRAERLEAAEWLLDIPEVVFVEPGEEEVRVVKADPRDDMVFAGAIAGGAAYVVAGDRQLLDLGSHHGVRVVTAAQFFLGD